MWLAEAKKQENIGEYILFMWQMEDIIRTFNLDLLRIEEEVIAPQKLDEAKEDELFEWYKSMINEMRAENVTTKGHLKRSTQYLNELNYLHENLLNVKKDFEYGELFKACKEDIEALKSKMGVNPGHDIEVCFNGLYGLLLMRLQKKEVLPDTEKALDRISKLIADLVKRYMQASKS